MQNLANMEAENLSILSGALTNLEALNRWNPELPESRMTAATHPEHKGRTNWFSGVCLEVNNAFDAVENLGAVNDEINAVRRSVNAFFDLFKERRRVALEDPTVTSLRTLPEEIEGVTRLVDEVLKVLGPLATP